MTILYSLTLFVGAALLFVLEPLIGQLLLPLLGSTPEVWNTTVLFFQATLLAGYAWAHTTSRLLAPRRQALLQLAVMAAAAVVLPIALPHGAHPPPSAEPIPWLLGTLAVTAGLPFFALAANGPMLQRWLSCTQHRAARDPYFLFAASNGGSLLGLLAYPLAVSPALTLTGQGHGWAIGYAVAGGLVAASAGALWLRPGRAVVAPAPAVEGNPPLSADSEAAPMSVESEAAPMSAESEAAAIDWSRRLRWLVLAAVPSSLMLGTTSYITRDIAPVPLLWVIPLALYLLTLVVPFAPGARPERLAVLGRRVLPAIAVVLVFTLALGSEKPLVLLLAVHLTGLTAAALMCHSLLAADRPAPRHLTEFYLWLALGGVIGGAFNALLAPVAFPTLFEYPLAIVAVCALRPRPPSKRPDLLVLLLKKPWLALLTDVIVAVVLGAFVALALGAARSGSTSASFQSKSLLLGLACGLSLNLARRPLRFALAMGAILLAPSLVSTPGQRVIARERSYFGIYRVVASDGARVHSLYDGTTLHGIERFGPGRPQPLVYYSASGPVGQAFGELPYATTQRTGVIGLGAGVLACYAPPGDRFTFFEVDPVEVRIARDPALFDYLRRCPANVVVGDGRLSLEHEPPGRFGLLVVDAFNSDAIPINLITREAVGVYFSRLQPTGALLFHITNRYLALEPVLGDIAHDLRLTCVAQRYLPTRAEARRGDVLSNWAILARTPRDLGELAHDGRWHRCVRDPSARTWTDQYSDLLGALRLG